MGYLRIGYVKEGLENPQKDCHRDLECFPLKVGNYRLKKHPLFSFKLIKYENHILTFSNKRNVYQVKANQYTFFTYKKTDKYQIVVFFEIMDEEPA